MGLNGVRNASKLRRISLLVGQPVLMAYSRYFRDQNDLIAFTSKTDAWVVNLKTGDVEPYCDEAVELLEDTKGQYGGGYYGVRQKPKKAE